jgi:hypothetical protein
MSNVGVAEEVRSAQSSPPFWNATTAIDATRTNPGIG